MFSDLINTYPISDIIVQSLQASEYDVKLCLQKSTFSVHDLATLLSPQATNYIEQMALKSKQLTQQRFGNVMQLFIPMYLSNECYNTCTYCGFSMEHKYKRVTLTKEEIKKEAIHLSQKGFKHILLLTGESPKKVGTDYICAAIKEISPYFSSIGIEVQPLSESDYSKTIQAGADSLTLYQETYHRESYEKFHLFGLKRNYTNRLDAVERGGNAGFHRINIGVLCGLYDFRYEAICLAYHLSYLMKHFWKTKFSISFPRITDMIGDFSVPYLLSDKHLVQLICTFRLMFPDIGITLSTRESPQLRDHLIKLGITQISAESNTSPGGYTDGNAEKQFETSDHRSIEEIISVLNKNGFDAVTKDWDKSLC